MLGGDFRDLKVTGIARDLPAKSHLKFDILISTKTFPQLESPNYIRFFGHVYVRLRPGSSAAQLEEKFPAMVKTYAAPQIENQYGQSWGDYLKAGNDYHYFLQPLRSIHLDSRALEETFTPSGSMQMLNLLSGMGILVLLFACVNFVNLTIVKTAERSQEAALRKVMGSDRWLLMAEILISAVLLVILATAAAVLAAQFILSPLNTLIQRELVIPYTPSFLLSLLGLALFTGFIASLYPALYFSKTPSLEALKGNFLSSTKGQALRNTLVLLQILLSSLLLSLAIVIHLQTDFLMNEEMGFDKDNTLVIRRIPTLDNGFSSFKKTIEQLPGVVSVSNVSRMPGERSNYIGEQYTVAGQSDIFTAKGMAVDDAFFSTLQLKVISGKSFSDLSHDSLQLMINRSAAKLITQGDPVGMKLRRTENNPDGSLRTIEFTISGVVEDFHFQPLQDAISPVVLRSNEYFPSRPLNVLLIKFNGDARTLSSKAGALWKEYAPDQPFVYSFMDGSIEAEYESYARLTVLFQWVTLLALLVSCLGLFGTSANTGHSLRKEVSIRKLMGATSFSIWLILIQKVLRVSLIAFLLSVPFAYWLSYQWLQNFAYRIALGWGPFVLTFVLIISLSLCAISFHAIKSALVKPLDVLRMRQ